ncbi:MAG TPA: MBL fold metallo-hydrolase [Candidatus Bathyarchaeia archaeon]|nr:MBL fold metallo-hydrolase [Candidatus Bathyarchaeia archaeon]
MTGKKIVNVDVNENIVMMRTLGTPFNEGNVICLNQKEGLIFIDAGRIAKDTAEFRIAMENRYNKKTLLAILTHSHGDHFFGLEAFKDVPVIATQQAIDEFTKQIESGRFTEKGRELFVQGIIEESKKGTFELTEEWHNDWSVNYLNANLYFPSIGVKDELTIGTGEDEYLFKLIGGHSKCSAYLYNKTNKILITGDNFNCDHAGNSSCMLMGAMNSVAILKQFEAMDVSVVLPGHGMVVDKTYISKTREYLEEMFAKLKEYKEKGILFDEVLKDENLPEFIEEKKPDDWNRILRLWYENV